MRRERAPHDVAVFVEISFRRPWVTSNRGLQVPLLDETSATLCQSLTSPSDWFWRRVCEGNKLLSKLQPRVSSTGTASAFRKTDLCCGERQYLLKCTRARLCSRHFTHTTFLHCVWTTALGEKRDYYPKTGNWGTEPRNNLSCAGHCDALDVLT